ncbi:hypothetical protein [Burkholderia gladioli]|uniref:hypothetical protein n=1 Tax=Burkholderia gladioli TaxID=28095 RepID=UPI00163F0F49|nr:hypothetical protein [Burkholderia gladioli]
MEVINPNNADLIYKFASVASVIGAVVVAVGSLLVFMAGNVRDRVSNDRMQKSERETALANKATEELRARNLALEQAIAPRIVEQNNSVSNLKQYTGTVVYLQAVPDFEARRLLGQLKLIFSMAGWVVHEVPPSEDLRDGVAIEYSSGIKDVPTPQDHNAVEFNFNERGKLAAERLKKILDENRVQSNLDWFPYKYWPYKNYGDSVLVVRVGLRPVNYFMDRFEESLPNSSNGSVIYGNRS